MLTKGLELGVAFTCSGLEEPEAGVCKEEEATVGLETAGLESVEC